jgi:alpha-tubulin suppressor-like RCC1 family protein
VFKQVSLGVLHTCAVADDGRAYCWGSNQYGQLGTGTYGDPGTCYAAQWACSLLPVAVTGDFAFRQVTAGAYHSCGITTDGRALCWGRNDSGQLGSGTAELDQLLPVPVTGGLTFASLDAGGQHTCGITLPDRRAYCWGNNDWGQLGNRSTTSSSAPVQVDGQRRFRQVSAGTAHTCGVTEMSRAFCWGYNRSGQLGDGSRVRTRLGPVRVAGDHAFRQVDAGGMFVGNSPGHTCGVTIGNQALCWGENLSGQLGNGSWQENAYVPVVVAGGLKLLRVSTGMSHTCGQALDNRAYCWGRYSEAQLGDDGTLAEDQREPVPVASDRRFVQVSAGGFHTCGVNRNGVAFCWGYNNYGELGDGTTESRGIPTRVKRPAS